MDGTKTAVNQASEKLSPFMDYGNIDRPVFGWSNNHAFTRLEFKFNKKGHPKFKVKKWGGKTTTEAVAMFEMKRDGKVRAGLGKCHICPKVHWLHKKRLPRQPTSPSKISQGMNPSIVP